MTALGLVGAVCGIALGLSAPVFAAGAEAPNYFLFNGNPVAAKYVAGKLMRLETQDASSVEGLKELEAVSALLRAPSLSRLTPGKPFRVKLLKLERPEYGVSMFALAMEGPPPPEVNPATLVWSGPARFSEIVLRPQAIDPRLKKMVIARSRRDLAPMLDYRAYKPVGRRLKFENNPKVRVYGSTAAAPHLAFIDVTWTIAHLPKELSERGIDSTSPVHREEFIIDTRRGKTIYSSDNDAMVGDGREMRLFQEAGGPLLMATAITCSDGDEPFILDLEHETFGTGAKEDVPNPLHCFPSQ